MLSASTLDISFSIRLLPNLKFCANFNAEFSNKNILESNSLISILKNESKFEFWLIKFTPSKKLFEIILLILKLHLLKILLKFLKSLLSIR